ncbi:LOW QUALITY PROTEIN: taste receptor type 1 member 1 [Glossophaga mutica]
MTPSSFSSHGCHFFWAVRFGIEEINIALLSCVTLGWELYDVCSESANVHAALSMLSPLGTPHRGIQGNPFYCSPTAVVLAGSNPTPHTASTAALPSPQAESHSCPKSLPHQAEIMALLLQSFEWVCLSLVSSDSNYGQLGVQVLENWDRRGICLTPKATVPFSARPGNQRMSTILCLAMRTTTAVIFSSRLDRLFSESMVLATLTAKVGVAPENWAISTHIKVPGIRATSTVLDNRAQKACPRGSYNLCNLYGAVLVAHSLDQLLGCASKACSRDLVHPWQLLEQIRKVNSLHRDTVTLNDNVLKLSLHALISYNSLSSYNITALDWNGPKWTFTRSLTPSMRPPVRLDINKTKPSPGCSIVGFHHCCFKCMSYEAGIFLNKSGGSPSEWVDGCTAGEGTSLGLRACTPDPRTRAQSLRSQVGIGWRTSARPL